MEIKVIDRLLTQKLLTNMHTQKKIFQRSLSIFFRYYYETKNTHLEEDFGSREMHKCTLNQGLIINKPCFEYDLLGVGGGVGWVKNAEILYHFICE